MDLVSPNPVFTLYNRHWPIRGETSNLPPAKFIPRRLWFLELGGRCRIDREGDGGQWVGDLHRRGDRGRCGGAELRRHARFAHSSGAVVRSAILGNKNVVVARCAARRRPLTRDRGATRSATAGSSPSAGDRRRLAPDQPGVGPETGANTRLMERGVRGTDCRVAASGHLWSSNELIIRHDG